MRQWIAAAAVAVVLLASGAWFVHAQVQVPANPRPAPGEVRQPPQILSGSEMGFRVDGWEGDVPIGRWVVRTGGKWVEPKVTGGVRRLSGD